MSSLKLQTLSEAVNTVIYPMDSTESANGESDGMCSAVDESVDDEATAWKDSPVKDDNQPLLVSSGLGALETRYIKLLEERIEVLEFRKWANDDGIENKNDRKDKSAKSARVSASEFRLRNFSNSCTDFEKQPEDVSSETCSIAKNVDAKEEVEPETTEEGKEDSQRQSRMLYRESRYNSEGICEEKDVEEDKDVSQTPLREEMQKVNASEPSIILTKRYEENGKYRPSHR